MKNVIETHDQIIIENIPRLEWGKETETSFIRSTQYILNSLGEEYSYEFLMGISGAAFRFHFNPDWCPSAADVTTGFDVSNILFKSLGYKCQLLKIDDNSFDDIRSLYIKIKSQINKGIPIIAINLKVCPVWGVITGYLKHKPGIICRTYFDETEDYSLAERVPWLTFFFFYREESMDIRKIYNNSLEIAIQLAMTNSYNEYLSGFSALEKWIEELEKFLQSTSVKVFEEYEVNLTLFDCLLDTRQAAVKYLTILNDSDIVKNGSLIIENYKKEVEILKDTKVNILPSFDSKPTKWTKNILSKQINTLNQVLILEKESIELITDEIKK